MRKRKTYSAIQWVRRTVHYLYHNKLYLQTPRPSCSSIGQSTRLISERLVGSNPPRRNEERTEMKTILIPIYEEKRSYHLNKPYVDYVSGAGYQPLMCGYDVNADLLSDICDGLLLSGGGDIDPIYYGEENVSCYWPDPDRDQTERNLYWAFTSKQKPVFGICRGFQLIYLEENMMTSSEDKIEGLEFKQHFSGHSQTDRVFRWRRTHRVYFSRGLYDLGSKDDRLKMFDFVNSMHHQGVKWMTHMKGNKRMLDAIKGPIDPLAYAPAAAKEPIILEAFRVSGKNVLAVQWHPEELLDYALLWNVFGEPTGAKKTTMEDYAKTMTSLFGTPEEANETV